MRKAVESSTPDLQVFREVFNASPIGIAVENLEGQLLFVNPAFCLFLGFDEEELCRKHWVDFSPPEDAGKDWALFQQLRTGSIDHYQIEKRYFRKDGSLVWGSLTISLLSSPPSSLVIAMVQDITEQKRVEEIRFLLAAIVETSEDAIVSATLDGVIASWNAGAQRLFGYTESETVGKSVTLVVPPELPTEEDRILETIKSGGSIRQFETVRVTKTGERINVSLSISPIKDSNGRIIGCSGIARDITERKQAEDRLREYERAVENAEEMIAVIDREYRYLIANRQFLKMRNMTQEQVVGRSAYEVLDKGFFETVAKPKLDECFQGRVVRYETKYSYPETGERDLFISYFPIEGRSGIDRVACIMHDITDRKCAEDALRASEERFRLAAQAGRMYSFDWDVTTDVVLRSSENADIVGLVEPLRFTHTQFVETMYPDDRARLMAAIAGMTPEKPTAEITYRMQNGDGVLVWLRSSGRAFFNAEGKMLRVIGMVADVTEIKQAEEVMRISEERLRLAQWVAHVGTFDLNLRTGVDVWQPETEAMYGLPPGGFGGTLTAFEDLIHPNDRERVKELTREMMRTGQPAEGEWRVVWPDGSVHWIAGRGQVFMNECGEPSRMLGVNMDITERKRADEKLSEMTRKMVEAQEQERARIGRELHDDINQQLAVLAIELEQLKENPSEVSIRVQELWKQVTDISNDVQALSHDLHSSKLEYLGVVSGMRSWCKEFGERQKMEIGFKSDVPSALPLDVGRTLFRLLQEALHNATKHSGVNRVDVQLREESGEIHLIVSDTGRGFDVEAALQGKGLGLTSMRERVRLVNGAISIDSKPMVGTTISARVPLPSEQKSRRGGGMRATASLPFSERMHG